MAVTPSMPSLQRSLLIGGSLILVGAMLYWARNVLMPLALAVLLAFILSPAISALQRRGLNRIFSVLLVVIVAVLLLGGIGLGVTLQLRSLAEQVPAYQAEIIRKVESIRDNSHGGVISSLQETFNTITRALFEPHRPAWEQGPTEPAKPEGTEERPMYVRLVSSGFSQLESALGPAAEVIATLALVIVLILFILMQREDLRNRLVRLAGHGRLIVTTRALDEAGRRISRYLIMLVVVNACFGIIMSLALQLLGVPYALLWGFIAGVVRFVPYLGTWVAAFLLLVFCVAALPSWTQLLLTAAVFAALEIITAQVVEPLLFGHSTGVSPLALLLAAAFWTLLWGPFGLLLSTPLTVCIVVLGKYVPQLEFFNVLLGDEPPLDAEIMYYQRLLAQDQDEAIEVIEDHLQQSPVDTVYDEVLLPALRMAQRDREQGELTTEEEQFIVQVTRDVLNDLILRQQQIRQIAHGKLSSTEEPNLSRPLVLACPARSPFDELALEMLAQLIEGAVSCRFEILSAQMLAAEVAARVAQDQPALVCIAALPPGGVAQTRYLCKRLKSQFPELKIAVGRWRQNMPGDKARELLQQAGADQVSTTLLECRDQCVPLLQVARMASAEAEQPRLTEATTSNLTASVAHIE